MTSNLGSDIIQDKHQESQYDAMKDMVMSVVGQHFRPEFINRVDEIVVFHPLGREQIKSIALIQLAGMRQRLIEKGFKLELSGTALDKIAAVGFDPVFGARPLKRAIQTEIENPLAQKLLSGEIWPDSTIKIDVRGDRIDFAVHD